MSGRPYSAGVIMQDAVGATGNGTPIDVTGLTTLAIQLTISNTATVTFEGAIGGGTMTAIAFTNLNTGTSATTATATGIYAANVAGLTQVQARVSAWTSGTVTAIGRAVQGDAPRTISGSGSSASPVLAAGENYIGSVGGTTRPATGTMTRTADTNAYTAGDGITTATSSPSAMSVTGAARVAAGSGIIFGGALEKSTTSTTNASFRGWIYQDTPSAVPNDNAAFTAAVHADYQKLVGVFTCDFSSAGIVGSDGVRAPITLERTNMAYKLASGTALTVILEARGAYTPGSAEVFRLMLDCAQD